MQTALEDAVQAVYPDATVSLQAIVRRRQLTEIAHACGTHCNPGCSGEATKQLEYRVLIIAEQASEEQVAAIVTGVLANLKTASGGDVTDGALCGVTSHPLTFTPINTIPSPPPAPSPPPPDPSPPPPSPPPPSPPPPLPPPPSPSPPRGAVTAIDLATELGGAETCTDSHADGAVDLSGEDCSDYTTEPHCMEGANYADDDFDACLHCCACNGYNQYCNGGNIAIDQYLCTPSPANALFFDNEDPAAPPYKLLYGYGACQETYLAVNNWPAVKLTTALAPRGSTGVNDIFGSLPNGGEHYLTVKDPSASNPDRYCLAYYWSGAATVNDAYGAISSTWPAFSETGASYQPACVLAPSPSPPPHGQ